MNKTTQTYKRRNYYIDKSFQTKFIMKFWLIVAAGSLLAMAVVYWLAQNSTTVAIMNGRVAVHTTAEYLLPLLVQTVLVELVIVSLATIAMMVFVSHKLAGPLYKLRMTLQKLSDGDLSSMRLRQNDQLQEVSTVYNETVRSLKEKLTAVKNASTLEEAKKHLDTFKL